MTDPLYLMLKLIVEKSVSCGSINSNGLLGTMNHRDALSLLLSEHDLFFVWLLIKSSIRLIQNH